MPAVKASPLRVDSVRFATREQWLAARHGWVGGSDAAAILGLDPSRSVVEVWAQKRSSGPPDRVDDERAFWGLELEEAIGRGFGKRHGREVRRPRPITVFFNAAFAGRATPDFFQRMPADYVRQLFARADREPPPRISTQGVLQIKTADLWIASHWEDEPPLKAQIQLQHEMAACGVHWGTLACLVGGNTLRWFDDVLRPEFVAKLDVRIRQFQHQVLNGIMPAVDGSASCRAALNALYPQHLPGLVVALPPEAEAIAADLVVAKDEIKAWEKREAELSNQLRAMIGEAEVGVLPSGVCYTLKTESRKQHIVAASSSRVLRRKKAPPAAMI